MSESILNELEAIDLGLVEIVVERDNYSIVKFIIDYGQGRSQPWAWVGGFSPPKRQFSPLKIN
jgi:hypothetical protein